MPTPIGHALAGLAIAWSVEAIKREPLQFGRRSTLAMTCAGLAICPDLDWLYPPAHRTMTHSIAATVATGAVIFALARRERSAQTLTITIAGTLAYGSHLLLDWFGGDTKLPAGIQLLWPFSDAWFISPVPIFRATDVGRFFRPLTMLSNGLAVLLEMLLLTPVALMALAWRRRALRASRAYLRERASRPKGHRDPTP
jgi:membrane-bound metal-dependent hydrolase YbcI (DUF457 family)